MINSKDANNDQLFGDDHLKGNAVDDILSCGLGIDIAMVERTLYCNI